MAIDTVFKVDGLAELDKILKSLPVKVEVKILRGAMRAGVSVIGKRAKELCPVAKPNTENRTKYQLYEGALRDSIKIRTKSKRGVVTATLVAGGTVKTKAIVYYVHMVEGGTKPHIINPKAKKALFFTGISRALVMHPGAKAKPFMRPALDQTAEKAIVAAADYVRMRLDKEATR